MAEWTRTSAPFASFTRFLDGAVSPEITMERSGPSNRYAKAGTTSSRITGPPVRTLKLARLQLAEPG